MFFQRLMLWLWMVLFSLHSVALEIDPLLAKVYRQQLDLSQWWVSEKLDGVRAIWDGQQLHFRSGRVIQVPQWFTRDFPQQPLDGELWMGRKTFEAVSAAVRRKQPDDQEWHTIQYRLFELPGAAGNFTQRLGQMQTLTRQAGIPWLQPVEQFQLDSEEALLTKLDQIVAAGGEGLMLHRADSRYHGGRSAALLKLKPWQDAEATVIQILPGKGKYAGMMGALLVEDTEGQRFRIGSGFSDQERLEPPTVGSRISYKHTGTTVNGLPRFASFLRPRPHHNE